MRCAPLLLSLLLVACNDRAPTPIIIGNGRPSVEPDLPTLDMGAADDMPTPRALCEPGQRRCIAENSPLVESCEADGRSYTRDACPDNTVCRDRRCVPFTCVANFPVCVGITDSATCAPDGRSVRDLVACPDNQSCRGGVCVDLCEVAAADRSYIGCDYIARDLPNIHRDDPETRDHPFAIVASNPHPLLPARVQLLRTDKPGVPVGLIDEMIVRPASGYEGVRALTVRSELFSVIGNKPLTVEDGSIVLPPGGAAALLIDPLQGLAAPIRIKSDRPVVAYQYNPYCCNFTATNDASLLLPTSTLGTSYRAVGYPSLAVTGYLFQSYLSIVAGDKPAQVRITHTSNLRLNPFGDVAVQGDLEGKNLSFTLDPYEEAIISAEEDTSGASIESDNPVAVFSGHPCTNVPQDQFACDHLEDQLPPADTLGTRYLLPALRSRGIDKPDAREGVYWQIVAHEDAILRFDPPLATLTPPDSLDAPVQRLKNSHLMAKPCADLERDGIINLARGAQCELGLMRTNVSVQSDKPIIIAGVLSGHQSTGNFFYGTQAGDPSLFILPPIEQIRASYAFVNPPTYKKTFATVAIPANTPLVLDGRQIEPEQRLEARTLSLRGQPWDVFSVELTPDAHTLSADERFLLIVYAYDDYVSYAFPGGLDLLPQKKD